MLNKKITRILFFFCLIITIVLNTQAQAITESGREHLRMDFDWKFAFGHPYETNKDFNNGTSYFSYLAKTGYGDGAAAPGFDDRSWRILDLPHDWAVEQGFSSKASLSHGYKAIGRNFPENIVGWYRKAFNIPNSDLGRRIHITFDGVFRNSIVWVNGHYLGTQASGYLGFDYDLTDYLNYGGENVIAVRVDATMEEGWFYEGAGIYRHVWLNKFDELHIAPNGTFVTSNVDGDISQIKAIATLKNEGITVKSFTISQEIFDSNGKKVSGSNLENLNIKPFQTKDFSTSLQVTKPNLWSLDSPYLYKLKTIIKMGSKLVDTYETTFGIRTITFDVDKGFFLNGKHVKIKGTNNHQDHAGLGVALPDGLQDFRIQTLKNMGSNAYRCSHNPPTPELLDACDRLGMLVIDENRLMGITQTELGDLKQLLIRDRNHPSIISWSIGNEEWNIEGNITGARIAATMQAFAKTIDSTRFITAAVSGGIGNGISTTIDVLGYNYVATKNTDEHHKKFPWQKSWGTEEGSTVASRGIYFDDLKNQQLAAYDKAQNKFFFSLEDGWKHYASRDYLAGMFIWTGFDYRGEPTPFGWPSTGSYFGMVDQCGFPKDDFYYLKSWWTNEPTLHVFPHWNWNGKEVQSIPVWVYSNADEVELFLNGKSQGKKNMEKNGHLVWDVIYKPGSLKAVGYKDGKQIKVDEVKTTGEAKSIGLEANKVNLNANKADVAIISVDSRDKNKLHVPTANNLIKFSIEGPAEIIGVGNGDPTSREADKYLETIITANIGTLKEKVTENFELTELNTTDYNDTNWSNAFKDVRDENFAGKNKILVYRGHFNMPESFMDGTVNLIYKCIGKNQSIYINGKLLAKDVKINDYGDPFDTTKKMFSIDKSWLKQGDNLIAIVASPLVRQNQWQTPNMDPGAFQIVFPAPQWKRTLFSGLAQIIIKSTGSEGEITLKAESDGLEPAIIKISAKESEIIPSVK